MDVVDNPRFLKFLPAGYITYIDKELANGIEGTKANYCFKDTPDVNLDIVNIEEITNEEFNRLNSLLNSGKALYAISDLELNNLRLEIIQRLSACCEEKIISGFHIKLSDGKLHNFSLTTKDQLNLMNLEGQLNNGADTCIYHADDELCKFFSRDDMTKIIAAFRRHIAYHTTYFNAVKHYINNLTDVEKLSNFTYGMEIAKTVNNPAIRQFLSKGEYR